MVHLVRFFMKTHLLALLQDNCLDLLHCVSLRKLSGRVRNITAFCQLLLRPVISDQYIGENQISDRFDISVFYTSLSVWKVPDFTQPLIE